MTGNVCELVPVLVMTSPKGEFNKKKTILHSRDCCLY